MAEINPCWKCGKRGPWRIRMDCDHLEATCSSCGSSYDIGNSDKGFVEEVPKRALLDRWGVNVMYSDLLNSTPRRAHLVTSEDYTNAPVGTLARHPDPRLEAFLVKAPNGLWYWKGTGISVTPTVTFNVVRWGPQRIDG